MKKNILLVLSAIFIGIGLGYSQDTDNDGLTDVAETTIHFTNPNHPDTDMDGIHDGDEIAGTYGFVTNPLAMDTDGGGGSDALELYNSTNPTAPGDDAGLPVDTDMDGLDDATFEPFYGTNPTIIDTDGDGLSDAFETIYGPTNPILADTDAGTVSDFDEWMNGTDPNNAADDVFSPQEIDVQGLGNSIANGDVTPTTVDNTDYGSVTVSTSSNHQFDILNTGGSPLTISGPVTVDNAFFTVTAQPASPVAAGGSTFFIIQFLPTCAAPGLQTATVTIPNDDADESPYTFMIQGVAFDGVAPTFVCSGLLDQSADPTLCTYSLADLTGTQGAADNCGAVTVTQVPAIGTSYNVGDAVGVTLTATDAVGNTSTCFFTFNVVDTELPSISCPGTQNEVSDPSCNFIIPDYTPLGSASDNCPGETITQSPVASTVVGVGITNIVLTVTDASGNTATCNFDIDVTCPGSCLNEMDVFSNQSIADGDVTPTTVDLTDWDNQSHTSGPVTRVFRILELGGVQDLILTDPGPNYVTISGDPEFSITVQPSSGTIPMGTFDAFSIAFDPTLCNTGVKTATVSIANDDCDEDPYTFVVQGTVVDDVDPTFGCPGFADVSSDPGVCTYSLPDLTGSQFVADDCPGVVVTQVPAIGTSFNVGDAIGVTLTATDASGNTATCAFSFNVLDNELPTITCPSDVVVGNDLGSCDATGVALGSPTTGDNCPGEVATNDAPGTFPLGTTIVTWTVTDASGNTESCTQNVTVNDTESPTIACPGAQNQIVDASCEFILADYTLLGVTADNCPGLVTVTQSPAAGSTITGATIVTLTATDVAGNTETCNFNVVGIDLIFPTIICPADVVVSNDPGTCEATGVALGTPTTGDNCPGEVASNDAPGTFPVGTTVVTWSVTDVVGNTTTCTQNVTVNDTETPTITCPSDVVVSNDPTLCDATGVALGSPTTADNCPGETTSNDAPGTFPIGTTIVTWTVTDAAGNTETCTQNVTVNDTEDPTISCPATQNELGDATCLFTIPDYTPLATPADNCPGFVVTQSPIASTVVGFGTTNITLTITDAAGNTETCNFDIDVTCPPCLNEMDVFSNQSIADGDVTPDVLDLTDWGTNTHTSFPITRNFRILETGGIQDLILTGTGPNYVTITGDPEFTISTQPASSTITAGTFVLFAVDFDPALCSPGVKTATISIANDDCDEDPYTFVVQGTVVDDVNPTFLCGGLTDQSADAGLCTYSLPDLTGSQGASDDCPGVVVTQSPAIGTSFNVGDAVGVTLTATDASGNTATCSFSFNILDNELPTITCPSDVVVGNDPTLCDATGVALGSPTTSDNCPGETTSNDAPATFPLGTTIVTWTVTDASGNTANCTQNVTVNDTENPTITCPSDVVVGNDPVSCDATGVALGSPTTSDNCPGETTSNDAPATFPIGTTVVTWTVTDAAGNTESCTQNVTVNDTEDPTITCPGTQNEVGDVSCLFTLPDYTLSATFSDNCPGATVTQSPIASTVVGVGTTNITLTITDAAGNTETCNFDLNVTCSPCTDPTAPTLFQDLDNVCPGTTVTLSVTGGTLNDAIDWEWYTGGCGGTSVGTGTTLVVNPLVSTTYCVRGEDGAGCVVEATVPTTDITVTVVPDVTPPTIGCPIDQLGSADVSCQFVLADYTGMAATSDNCTGAITVTQLPLAGTIVGIGNTTIELTATDAVGNTNTCTFDVIVSDVTAPTITCPGDQNQFVDGACQFALADYTGLASTSDNCDPTPVLTQFPLPGTLITGATVVTLTSTDASLNFANCNFNVIGVDIITPTITCPADVITSTDLGSCVATGVVLGTPVSADNCPGEVVTNDAPGTYPIGVTVVTWTVTDISGNTETCTQNVTVNETELPTITCPADVVVGNDPGACDATGVALGTPTAADNCPGETVSNDAPATFPLGTTVVTWTVTDAAGNTASCTQNVTVNDTENPTVTCPADVVVGNDLGSCDATGVALGLPTTADNCPGETASNDAPGTYPLGTTVVTWTVTDAAGNTESCTQNVTVNDTETPTITCPADVITNTDLGSCVATGVVLGSATTADNCPGETVSNDAPASFPAGTTIVTWTVTDAAGNTETCTQNVTVNETELPTITCPADVVVSNDLGSCDATGVALGTPTAADNCPGETVSNDAPATFPLGTTVVTWTVTDASGNTASCTQNVTVNDTENPTVTCPADVVVGNDLGSCDATGVALGTPTTSDNCPGETVVNDAPGTFPLGTTVVTWTVTDAAGNTESCTQNVTVNDTEGPSVTCPGNQSETADASCNFTIPDYTGMASSSDNCPGVVLSQLPIAGTVVGVGITNVVITATDASLNTANCNFDVIVTDGVNPTITCPGNQLENTDASCQFTLPDYTSLATAADNCNPSPTVTQSPLPGTVVSANTVITLTADDGGGNTADCNFTVILQDNLPPSITCPADQNESVDASCQFTLIDYTGMATATDNCNPAPLITQSPLPGTVVSANTVITLTADDGSGNTANCNFNVILIDNTIPTITCPADVVVGNDLGSCDATGVALGTPTTADNCPGETSSNDAPATFPLGTTVVTWTVTDAAGNTASCTQNVTVNDTENPTVTCPADVVVGNDLGSCDATGVALGLPTTADNCPGETASNDAPGTYPLGTTVVTWTVTDAAGNTESCTQNVTVNDTETPTITCPADVITNTDLGSCVATGVVLGSATTADNCPGETVSNDAPVSFPAGTTIVTWTVTDAAGNTETCTQNVTVNETELPTITCPADVVVGNDLGSCDATGVALGLPTTTDNCPGETASNDAPGTFPLGTTVVTWTVTDASGNTASCTQNVTVNDTENPTVTCPADVVVGNDLGSCDATGVALGTPTTSDNCPGETVVNDAPVTYPIGTTVVTWTVTDAAGNTESCTQNVTVNDTEGPSITCPSTQNESSGALCSFILPDYTGAATSSDNCPGLVTITQLPLPGTVVGLGTTNITLTATDAALNVSNCNFDVVVTDAVNPTITCPADIAVNNDAGACGAIVNYIAPAGADNCPGATTAQIAGLGSGSLFPVGVTTETYEVTDASGNTETCSFTITVTDTEFPIALCAPFISSLDGTGNSVVLPADIDAGSSDNCPIASMTVTPNAFTCADLGANAVTLTVVDVNGNTSTCATTVTVINTNGFTITCTDVTVSNDPGNCDAVVNYTPPVGTDNCLGGVTTVFVSGLGTGATFPVGTTVETYMATDSGGNTLTCSFNVTVNDTELPTIVCSPDIIVGNDPGSCDAVVTYPATVGFDNCPSPTVTPNGGLVSGSTFPIGTTTQSFTVIDASGNTATCSFDVTVVDTEAPSITCPADIVTTNDPGVCGATIVYTPPVGADNCPGSVTSLVSGLGSGSLFPLGVSIETYQVVDAGGNTTTCSFTITITDTDLPVLVCPADIVVSNDPGACDAVVNYTTPVGTDSCPGAVTTQTTGLGSGSTFPLGTTTETYLVTDAAGNTASCSFTVTVNETELPVITCPADITLNAIPTNCGRVVTFATPTFSDNCPGVTMAQTDGTGLVSGSLFPVGVTTLEYTATDATGNTQTCTFDITIVDVELPVINNCPSNISVNTDLDLCSADVTWAQPTASDNCPGVSMVTTHPPGSTFALGTTTVTYTATDASGLTTTCSFDVTVTDIQAPSITCAPDQNQTADAGVCNALVTVIAPMASDNCGIASVLNDFNGTADASDTYPVGTTTVVWTATDVNGNTETCTQLITITDDEAPLAVCSPFTVQLDGTGNATITAANVDGGSTDNCGIASLTVMPNAFTCAEVGANTVTLTVVDVNGNTSTCTTTVTVQDLVAPTATCQPFIAQLDATGNVSITPADVDNGSVDNCAIATMTVIPNSFTCAEVGANAVTLTVVDTNGNTSTCTTTVTVEDNVAPTATCTPFIAQLDATGNVTITGADVDGGSVDACGIASLTVMPNAFTCAEVGANAVTLTVVDNNGNTSTCATTVTVEDNVAPTATCTPFTAQLDATGNVTITAADVDGGSSDACGIATMMVMPNTFTCAEVGANTVTLTVVDNNGNTSTCTTTVTVEDNVAPTATCTPFTAQLDATGNVSITAADVDGGSIDACGIATMMVMPNTFTCAEVGANTVTLTVVDNNGNTSTCTTTVTVEDNVAPTATCAPFTAQLDGTGNVTITGADVDGGSVDACGIASLTVTPNTFTCAEVGANAVTLTVTDNNGNVSTCTTTVTVEDNVAPTATCTPFTAQLDATGNVSITPADVDGGSIDNCTAVTMTVMPNTFTCAEVGANTVTLTVVDGYGNTSTCTTTVTVEDNVAPTATCTPFTAQLDATGNVTITAADVDGGSVDACGIATMMVMPNTFTCAEVGANAVTLTVVDNNGNTSTCTTTVTVEDNVAPTATCTPFTAQLDATGNVSITPADVDGGSIDACGIASLTVMPNTFTCAEVGANTVTLTVTDNNGNVSTCTTTVTVEDNVAPVAVCTPFTAQLDITGNIVVTGADVDGGSSDACGIASLTVLPNTFTCADLGAHAVTLTVVDNNGNTSTCATTVTVEDNVPPTVVCLSPTVQLDAFGNAFINVGDIDGGSTDACGIASTSIDITSFDCSNVGPNNVTLTVVDVNGNTSTCVGVVTIEDNIAPVVICQNITVQLDATGNVSIAENDVDNGSNDACGPLTYDTDITDFTCADVGPNAVVLTVTDANGNSATCNATVTVEDNVFPIALCQDIIVQLDATGNVAITPADVDNGSSDACGFTLSLDVSAFTCADVGGNTVTLSVTDASGNTSTCTSTVTVEDNVDPIAICAPHTVQLDPTGNGVMLPSDIDGGSSDACGFTLSASQTAFTCADLGANNVTLTVTDSNGNTATCVAVVTVEDNNPPTALCQDITVQLDASGNATIVPADIDAGSGDGCGVITLTIDINSFTCSDVGPNLVTLTVTDGVGNTDTCTSTVTIEDNVAPTVVCQNITVQLDGTGNATIVATDIDGGSVDACGIATYTASQTAFTCADVGANNVTLTVVDVNGNTSTCVAVVTIEDTLPPVITTCAPDVIVSADPGVCDASSVAIGMPIGSDNCTPVVFTNDGLAVYPLGNTTVTWTATDAYGNTSTCIQIVTVIDSENPVITCPADLVVTTDAGSCDATFVLTTLATATDNCAGVVVTNDAPATFPIGSTNVTWTATDGEGNTDECTQVVTVIDNEVPAITCPADITIPADLGQCSSTGPAIGMATATDNCTIASITNDAPVTFPIGMTTVTWTATDMAGNTMTCTQDVTIVDTESPLIVCSADVNAVTDAGSCFATGITLTAPLTFDACGAVTLTDDAPASYPLGTTTVTWIATDLSGNTSVCTQDVTVTDTEAPSITCPGDITVSADAGICEATSVALGTPTTSDNCTVGPITNDAPATFPLGSTNVTWTVMDGSGNISTCVQVVTVEDNELPTITCPADVIVSAGGGSCTASLVGLGTPVTADNCSVASVTNDGLITYPLGATIVTWTVTDGSGNTASCTQTVTVVDTENPTILCPADVTVPADAGTCVATGVSLGTPFTADNCSVASFSNDAVEPYALGNTTVTWTVVDGSGNTATCVQIVTVVDDQDPVITCPADIVVSADFGTCGATGVTLGNATATDNCSIASITSDAVEPYALGVNIITWTAIDGSGNVVTCTQTVTVTDDEAPVVTCPTDVVVTADAGVCEATGVALGAPTVSDNCSIASITNDAVEPFALGTTLVTWTIVDGSGNTTTCNHTVTVTDDEVPTITCPADVVVDSDPGVCYSTTAFGTPTTSDNCSVASVTNDAPLVFPVGSTVVTWTVTDGSGNTATCTQNVTVNDVELPLIACPADVIAVADAGTCGATGVALGTPVTADNCTVVSVTNDGVEPYALGVNTITWTVTDASGNTATCTQTVTVVDTELPTITCPADITVSSDPGICTSSVALAAPVTADNCSVASVTNNAPPAFPLGTTAVTWTVIDGSGNFATCVQMVTVEDTEAPMITCPADISVFTDPGVCSAVVSVGTPTTSDNCSIASVTNDSPGTFLPGTTVVTWTIVDGSGNSTTCTQNVTVIDNEFPTITCPADITVTADLAFCYATGVNLGTPTTADNCGVASVTNDGVEPYALGVNVITWTVVDIAGNTTTCTQLVTVTDDEAPTIVCPADIVQSTDPGVCSAVVATGTPVTSDNCSVALVTSNEPAVFPLGTTTVTWTVLDGSGNTATCTQLVTVVDTELPTITCPTDVTVPADLGVCVATGVALGSPVFGDNCSIASIVNDAPAAFPLGANTVTWTVTDGSGNTATCTQIVTVIDTQAPTIVCPGDMLLDNVPGNCGRVVNYPAPVILDNCSVLAMNQTDGTGFTSGSFFPIGTTYQEYTITDAAGFTSTCGFFITIEDNELPTITNCPADMVIYSTATTCEEEVTWGIPAATDNCPGTVLTSTHMPGDTFPIGITTVSYQATDAVGNISTCIFTIEVVDTIAPVMPLLANVNASCSATLDAPTAQDNCAGTIVATTSTVFPITTIGVTPVIWTYDDGNGNITTQTQFVVIDGVVDASVTLIGNNTIQANNTNPGVTYEWINCETVAYIAGANDQIFDAPYLGQFAVIVTEPGCEPAQSPCITINNVGIQEVDASSLVLYPNPSTSGLFNVKYDGEITAISVFDMLGRVVNVPVDVYAGKVDGSSLATGNYMVRIETTQGVFNKEVTIIK